MRSTPLARDYLHRAQLRLRAVQLLFELGGWADTVRESQEDAERALQNARFVVDQVTSAFA